MLLRLALVRPALVECACGCQHGDWCDSCNRVPQKQQKAQLMERYATDDVFSAACVRSLMCTPHPNRSPRSATNAIVDRSTVDSVQSKLWFTHTRRRWLSFFWSIDLESHTRTTTRNQRRPIFSHARQCDAFSPPISAQSESICLRCPSLHAVFSLCLHTCTTTCI